MKAIAIRTVIAAAAAAAFPVCAFDAAAQESQWQDEFGVSKCALQTSGRNQYFVLELGYQTLLEGPDRVPGRAGRAAVLPAGSTRLDTGSGESPQRHRRPFPGTRRRLVEPVDGQFHSVRAAQAVTGSASGASSRSG